MRVDALGRERSHASERGKSVELPELTPGAAHVSLPSFPLWGFCLRNGCPDSKFVIMLNFVNVSFSFAVGKQAASLF